MAQRYRVRGPNGAEALVTVPSPGCDERTFDRRVKAGEIIVVEGGPTDAVDEAVQEEVSDDDERAQLRAEYTELAGEKPDHRWKAPRLQREIAALLADDEE